MDHLRIAAVQLDYQPVTRACSGGWRLGEPLAPSDPLTDSLRAGSYLVALKAYPDCRDVCERLLKDSQQAYVRNLEDKLKEILNFCLLNEVDIVAFPEYAVPIASLNVLRRFSSRMAIVAGLGCLQRSDLDILGGAEVSNLEEIETGNNIALILSPSLNVAVAKKNSAQNEDMIPGNGPRIERIQLSKGIFTIGVGICLDFMREQSLFYAQNPDVVVIPALSRNTAEFVDEIPRDFVRVFANHATHGGTYIGAPLIRKALGFANQNGTMPMARGVESIVIVDWDFGNPYPTRPSGTTPPDHRFYAMSSLIYSGRDIELAGHQKRINAILTEDKLRVDDLIEHASLLRASSAIDKYEPLQTALTVLLESRDTLADDEMLALVRHCLLSESLTLRTRLANGCKMNVWITYLTSIAIT